MLKRLSKIFRRDRRKWVSVSQTGLRRSGNEDALLADFERGVYCVADGMGGGEFGEVASRLIIDNLRVLTYARDVSYLELVQNVLISHQEANGAIIEYAQEHEVVQMGSTVATLVFEPGKVGRAAAIWAGDSRVYQVRHGIMRQLTRDHRFGLSNMLTRAVGVASELRCDIKELEVRDGDRFIVCSDGVHGVFSDVELKRLVIGRDINRVAAKLEAEILSRGAPDNYSFIIVQV